MKTEGGERWNSNFFSYSLKRASFWLCSNQFPTNLDKEDCQDYDDYRFHDAICYQADGADIFAVADGVVKQADAGASWQIILQCGQYQVAYQGVQNCTVTSGEKVTAGQIIGTAGTTLCVKAVK